MFYRCLFIWQTWGGQTVVVTMGEHSLEKSRQWEGSQTLKEGHCHLLSWIYAHISSELVYSDDFCIYIRKEYWPVCFFFSWNDFVWLWWQSNTGSKEWFRNCSFLDLFLGDLRRIDINSSLNNLQNLTVKPADAGLFFARSFLITN